MKAILETTLAIILLFLLMEVFTKKMEQQLIDMLAIQLKDNRKAGWVDENLNNVLKRNPEEEPVRAQYAFYEYLKRKNK